MRIASKSKIISTSAENGYYFMYLWLREKFLMLEFVLILGATASCFNLVWCFALFRYYVYIFLRQLVALCTIILKALHWGTYSDFSLECYVIQRVFSPSSGLDHHNCVFFDRGNNLDYRKKNCFFFKYQNHL